jgi:protein arginine kinase activator
MNCEKCKNKKATVFYADEGGGKHALCASCNAARLRVLSPEAQAESRIENEEGYFPSSSLLIVSQDNKIDLFPKSGDGSCKGCGATEELVSSLGHMLCPDCYGTFLFNVSAVADPCNIHDVKKPYAIQESANRTKLLNDLRARMKEAIDEESFEKAAALRDKIRAIESKTK